MQTKQKVVGVKKLQLKKSVEGSGHGPAASKHLKSKRKPVPAHELGGGDRPLPLLDVSEVAEQLADDDINESKDEFFQYVPPTPPAKKIKGRKTAKKSPEAHNKENIPQSLEGRQTWFGFRAGMLNNFGKQSTHSKKENQGDVNASLICFKKSKQAIYSVNRGGNKMLVTCDEYKALNSQRTNLPTSVMACENRDVTHKIRWNISKCYREHHQCTTQQCQWKRVGWLPLPPIIHLCRTRTIAHLINHFFNACILKGTNAVPFIEELDPPELSDKFFEKVINRATHIQTVLLLEDWHLAVDGPAVLQEVQQFMDPQGDAPGAQQLPTQLVEKLPLWDQGQFMQANVPYPQDDNEPNYSQEYSEPESSKDSESTSSHVAHRWLKVRRSRRNTRVSRSVPVTQDSTSNIDGDDKDDDSSQRWTPTQ